MRTFWILFKSLLLSYSQLPSPCRNKDMEICCESAERGLAHTLHYTIYFASEEKLGILKNFRWYGSVNGKGLTNISLTAIDLARHRATLVVNVVTHENKSAANIAVVIIIKRIPISLMSLQYSAKKKSQLLLKGHCLLAFTLAICYLQYSKKSLTSHAGKYFSSKTICKYFSVIMQLQLYVTSLK